MIRYEEEIVVEFDEEKTAIINEYVRVIRQVEQIMLRPDTYGHPQDDMVTKRRAVLKTFYEYAFSNPLLAARALEEYKEPQPTRAVFMEGYRKFNAWVNGIIKSYTATNLYQLTKKAGDLRTVFASFAGLKSLQFIESLVLSIPEGAKLIESPDNNYLLDFGIRVKVYELPEKEANLYIQENPVIEGLPPTLQSLLKEKIADGMREMAEKEVADYTSIFEDKTREYRQMFLDECALKNIPLTPEQALAMGRECPAWTVKTSQTFISIARTPQSILSTRNSGYAIPSGATTAACSSTHF